MRRDMNELVFESFADKVSKFDEKVKKHLQGQSSNPFSGSFQSGTLPRFSATDYARPIRGSKSEQRGQKAHSHVCREIMELCEIINEMSQYKSEQRLATNSRRVSTTKSSVVRFGDLFQMYTKISNKVVGLLLAAKKRALLHFEGEMLFQRRDDDVLITLTKSIEEIRKILSQTNNET